MKKFIKLLLITTIISLSFSFYNVDASDRLTLDEYKKLDATTLARYIREGKTSSKELIEFAFEIIENTNPELNNILSLRKEEALKYADNLEDNGQPFYGVPILVKGLGHTLEGGINSQGLSFFSENISKRSGRHVRTFEDAGFVVIGQTKFPQMGWINVTNSELYGDTKNPWNLDYNPGGSSGGSSAAVAVGQVPVASTTDGGGSTRIPASWSGVIGLHPSRGILNWDGNSDKNTVTSFANTKSVEDTRSLFEFLVKDSKKENLLENNFDKTTKIAYTTKTPAGTPISEDAVKAVKEAVEFLKSEGYQLDEVDYPIDGKFMMQQYYILASSSASTLKLNAKRVLGRELEAKDVELLTWALYKTGMDLTKEDVNKAFENIKELTVELNKFYEKYPIFLTPTNSYPAPEFNYNHIPNELKSSMLNMETLTKEEKLDLIYKQWLPAWTLTPYTQISNLAGTPAISLPTYVNENNLPLGIMFSTFQYNDRSLIEIAKVFEDSGKFKLLTNTVEESLLEASEETELEIEESFLETNEETELEVKGSLSETSEETDLEIEENLLETNEETDLEAEESLLEASEETELKLEESLLETSEETELEVKGSLSETSEETKREEVKKEVQSDKNNPNKKNENYNPYTGDNSVYGYYILLTFSIVIFVFIVRKSESR